jgi:fucose permease
MTWYALVLLLCAAACLVIGAGLLAYWAGFIVAGLLLGAAGIGSLERATRPVKRP